MKKVLTIMVMALALCACSKQPKIHAPKKGNCLEYGQRTLWGQQTLQNSDLNSHFQESLDAGLAVHGLRLCDDGEKSSYRLTVTEVRANFQDAGLRPSLMPSGNALYDVVSGLFTYVATTGVKKTYRAVAGIEYKIDYTAALSHDGQTRWLVRDDRPHFKICDAEVLADLRNHYTEFAGEVVTEIVKLQAR